MPLLIERAHGEAANRHVIGHALAAGTIAPSQLLRKFASYPRQHDLAVALREIGRVERSLFIIDWVLDPEMRRRAQLGLKNALRIGR